MKAADIMQRLGGLDETDRSWILDRLSPAAKRSLLRASESTQERQDPPALRPAVPAPPTPAPSQAAPAAHDAPPKPARRIGLPLGSPSWLIAAVLQAHDEADRAFLLKSMAHHQRQDVERIRRSGIVLTDALRERLLRLSEKCGETVAAPDRSQSRFEALVDKVSAARSRRRFWRHR